MPSSLVELLTEFPCYVCYVMGHGWQEEEEKIVRSSGSLVVSFLDNLNLPNHLLINPRDVSTYMPVRQSDWRIRRSASGNSLLLTTATHHSLKTITTSSRTSSGVAQRE